MKKMYVEKSCCPDEIKKQFFVEYTAVNAAAIVTGKPWCEIVKSLISQCHIRKALPGNKTCISDMLRANGFVPLRCYGYADSLIEDLDLSGTYDSYIFKLKYGDYFAVLPSEGDEKTYYMAGITRPGRRGALQSPLYERFVEEVYIFLRGSDSRTGKRGNLKRRSNAEKQSRFISRNLNPEDRNTGDCAVRALAAVLDCSWDEALDRLAEACEYRDPAINSKRNIDLALKKLGFERREPMTDGGRYPTASQLCHWLGNRYTENERVFAFVGSSHCAAIIPSLQGDQVIFKVQDTWDSTGRNVSEYWLYKKSKAEDEREERNIPECLYNEGDTIRHPLYGVGIVQYESETIIEVEFENGEIKKISKAWLRNELKE